MPLVRAFAPDVLATQLGVDAYVHDPLTHLALTTHGYEGAVRRLGSLGYPWLAFGGGGYDLDAVPRCWTLAYGIMLGREWADVLPSGASAFLDSQALRDGVVTVEDDVMNETRAWADQRIEELKVLVFPHHGL